VDTDKGLAQAAPTPAPRVERRSPAAAPQGFSEFFRAGYREVVKTARYAGATEHEADEATAAAMKEVLRRWGELDDPLAYARRAAVSNFVKEKTRNLDRVRRRLVEQHSGTPEGREDPALTVWEDGEWVMQVLTSLPTGQRDALALVVDELTPTEIAVLLGCTSAAIRQRLHDARQQLIEEPRRERIAEPVAKPRRSSARKEGTMTIYNATPDPMDDPEQVGRAFGEVFDLVDEAVEGITDAEIEERLHQLLAETAEPAGQADLDVLGRMLRHRDWDVSQLDPAKVAAGLTCPEGWDEARRAVQGAWEQVAVARREAAEQLAAAAAARQQAVEVTAGVNAYVDAALDRADRVLADARAEAERLVATAERQADEIVAAARTHAVPADVTRRNWDPHDWIRQEIATALSLDLRVVPVLLSDAALPSAGELPDDLAALTRRRYWRVKPTTAATDISRLVENLAELLGLVRDGQLAPDAGEALTKRLREAAAKLADGEVDEARGKLAEVVDTVVNLRNDNELSSTGYQTLAAALTQLAQVLPSGCIADC
jgi:RNA polymerase sigma factor (sigma-70 family)